MKLGLLPLFKPESFTKESFNASGLEYFSAHALGEVVAFVQAHFSEVQPFVCLNLQQLLQQKPDIVMLWATSPCFGLATSMAENIKTYLDIPVWLAGPHISYLPQSLPEYVDLGIIGEVELPLKHLLAIFLKQPQAGPAQYRRVPGIVYQSQGRMYSGSPAQLIADLNSLPDPNYRLFLDFPGFTAPVVRSARVADNLLTTLAYAPSRKERHLSPAKICTQLEQIAANYAFLFQSVPIPPEQRAHYCPVFIADQQLFKYPDRLLALKAEIERRGLQKSMFFIMSACPEQLNPELIMVLKFMNVRKLMFHLAPFGHQNPLFSQLQPQKLSAALRLCRRYQIDVVGFFCLNPEPGTTRQQLADTYLYLQSHYFEFERLQFSLLGPFPGLSHWEHYAKKYKPDAQALERFPWHSLDWDQLSPDLPLLHQELEPESFKQIYHRFRRLGDLCQETISPREADEQRWNQALLAQMVSLQYLSPQARVLEVLLQPQTELRPFIQLEHPISQIQIVNGALSGALPTEPLDMILLVGSLNGLKDPRDSLQKLKQKLKADGQMYIQALNPLCVHALLKFLNWPAKRSQQHYRVLKWLKPEFLEQMLISCGMEIVKTDYTIIKDVEKVRPVVETLVNRLEHYGSVRIPQHLLYISEIKILARNSHHV